MEEKIEKPKAEEKKPEVPKEDTDEGDKPKELGIIERASVEREKLEETLAKITTERQKLEEIKVNEKLGGGTEGAVPEKEKVEESPKEYADKVMKNEI